MAEGASSSGSRPKKTITTFELLDDGKSFAVEVTDDEDDDPACHGRQKHPVPVPEPEQLPVQQQPERPAEQQHQPQPQPQPLQGEPRPRLWQRAHLFWQRSHHGQQQEPPGQQPPRQRQAEQIAQRQQEHLAEHREQEQGLQQVLQEQHDRQLAQEEHGQQAERERLWERLPQRMEELQLAVRQRQRQPWWPELPDPQTEGGDGIVVKNFKKEGRFTVVWKEIVFPEDPNAGRELNPEPEPAPWQGPRGHVGPSSSRTAAVENREEDLKEEIEGGRRGNECQTHDQDSLFVDGSHPELFSWFMRLNFEVLP